MLFNREKFKSLVHYICWKRNADPSKLGAVKLNKILWLSDFRSYYETGSPISGARYVKRQFGPVPSSILPVLAELESEGEMSVTPAPLHSYIQTQYRVNQKPAVDQLTPAELALTNEIIDLVCDGYTAKSISDFSHDHIWKTASDGEEIPYFTIFANPVPASPMVREWALPELGEMQA